MDLDTPNNAARNSATSMTFADWSLCAQPPDSVTHPDKLSSKTCEWLPALVPGTVASTLRAIGRWTIDAPLDADANDWWYRTTFAAPTLEPSELCHICLEGLATFAEVWLNGTLLLTADNMFRDYRIDITQDLHPNNELTIVFRSLTKDLQQKRLRPRWKTKLVNNQQLRWRRTTLLGRIPGWSAPVNPVGPWRPVKLAVGKVLMADWRLVSTIQNASGTVTFFAHVASVVPLTRAVLHVGQVEIGADITPQREGCLLQARLEIPNPPLWWPHTHGDQPLLDCTLDVHTAKNVVVYDLGQTAFRSLDVRQDPEFSIHVNGIPIYCRGACWTVSDLVTLDGTIESLIHDLRLARAAGINMLRVGGTMIYENDTFYRLCDELGILVWQDFMFANMDYPIDDLNFAANITAEASYQLGRLSKHPSIAVYCGNSEVEQQAAMLGMPRELWRNRWFAKELPALCAEYAPGIAYVPSTPSGGVMPFHVRDGIAHYYGVGGYLRSPEELRRADVKFSPECLAFANVPEPTTVDAIMDGKVFAAHDPLWKQRVPRDTGAGWDFEDVRDHYLREIYSVDPIQLRSYDPERYLQLSRVVTGEIMARAFSEWRSSHSHNHGGLVWFFKDLWPASGWGIVDSLGIPKAAYYYLRRVWQNRQIIITDEGLDGIHLHVINETAKAFDGFVELLLLRQPQTVIARQEFPLTLPSVSCKVLQSDEILKGFYDVGHAYRFGPAKHDVVIATLYDIRHEIVSEAFHFLQKREPPYLSAIQLRATAVELADGHVALSLESDCFLQSISLESKGFLPDDNYFHLAPCRLKKIRLRPYEPLPRGLRGYVWALNLREPIRISATSLAK